ncbi:hypothetical protein ACTFIW_001025 [Dictyostelium discoideum]
MSVFDPSQVRALFEKEKKRVDDINDKKFKKDMYSNKQAVIQFWSDLEYYILHSITKQDVLWIMEYSGFDDQNNVEEELNEEENSENEFSESDENDSDLDVDMVDLESEDGNLKNYITKN